MPFQTEIVLVPRHTGSKIVDVAVFGREPGNRGLECFVAELKGDPYEKYTVVSALSSSEIAEYFRNNHATCRRAPIDVGTPEILVS